jgi:hypothetical protein
VIAIVRVDASIQPLEAGSNVQGFVYGTGERRIRRIQSGAGDADQKQRGRYVKHANDRDLVAASLL